MRLQELYSSHLKSVAYDPQRQTLLVEFRNGALYEFYQVPEEVFRGLISASSHGRFFNRHIRQRFPYRRLR
ncbi:KTSC domain-containing protein [Thermosulfuriphilus ammonigenes]|uniref:KTSC domain-containing protein n=1 Tax=Thermosulfuriphilus ammonigenes TaxID=1936021 RepID=A0A6G7PX04_9BACT|nr:KTSC domain-containing protein [Thermosulfuriphilus ammonigenes]MBA2847857.1 hypothetical protein [Thermosulfuriphilus ammonigenes]QIJ71943.1 KTSC domain-containing protein [Thermosulfuriphilus ammonigenes]